MGGLRFLVISLVVIYGLGYLYCRFARRSIFCSWCGQSNGLDRMRDLSTGVRTKAEAVLSTLEVDPPE